MNPPEPHQGAEPDPKATALLGALARVAARALMFRQARTQDWDSLTTAVDHWCWANLDQALDELEQAAPAMHAELAQQQAAMLAQFRADLGLPPEGATD